MRVLLSSLLLAGFITFGPVVGHAQSELLFGHFDGVQQGLQLNTAAPQRAKVSVALPSLAAHYRNSVFDLGAFEADMTSRRVAIASALAKVPSSSSLSTRGRIDLLGVAVRTERSGTFSLGISQRYSMRVSGSSAGFDYLFEGDASLRAQPLALEGYKAEGVVFGEVALGYQAPVNPRGLRWGGRVKLLTGQLHGYVVESRLLTMPNAEGVPELAGAGTLRSSGFTEFDDGQEATPGSILLGAGNPGLALDLGITVNDGGPWTYGFAVTDLGAIRWRNKTQDYVFDGPITTTGLAIRLPDDASQAETIDSLVAVFTSLKGAGFTEETVYDNPYTRALFPTLRADLGYRVGERLGLGITYRAQSHGAGVSSAAGISAVYRPARQLQLGLSYGYDERVAHLLGAGLVAEVSIFQLFASTDNLLGLINRDELQATTARVGLNLVFPTERKRQMGRRQRNSLRPGRGQVRCPKF